MRYSRGRLGLFVGVTFLLVSSVFGQKLSAQILGEVPIKLFSPSVYQTIEAELTVYENGKLQKTRTLELYLHQDGAMYKVLTQVLNPSYLKNLKFLVVKDEKQHSSWVKTSQGVKRLSPDSRPEALFGSDFLSSDFSFDAKNWKAVEVPNPQGFLVYEGREADKATGLYRKIYLREKDHMLVTCEYLDAAKRLVRSFFVGSWTGDAEDVSSLPLVLRSERSPGNYSELRILKHDQEKKVAERLFLPGNL